MSHPQLLQLREQRPIFGRPFVKRFAVCYGTVVCLSVVSVCNIGVLQWNGWMDQDETWHGGRVQPWPHCVRWGPRSSSPKRGHSNLPHFLAHVYCGQTARRIKMPLGMGVGLGPDHIVLDGDPAPPNFWPMYVVAKRLDGSRCHLVRK